MKTRFLHLYHFLFIFLNVYCYYLQSPHGCTVASAAGDETLRFWNVFGTLQVAKPKRKTTAELLSN
ncbi:hypothetical protein ACS0TY_000145 [Phlomoides rotata]